MLYLGIDQHHKQLTISLRDEDGNVILKRQVSTRPAKVRDFLEDVVARSGGDGFMAIVEVCGFNDWLLELLDEFRCREVVLLHPEKRSRRKTDRRDAAALSELLWVNRDRLRDGRKPGLRRVVLPSADDQQDRQLTSLRKRLGQLRTRTINKIKNILRRHNLTWDQPTKTFQTSAVAAWLKTMELGEMDRMEMDMLLEQWAMWERQISQADGRIKRRAARNPLVTLLKSAPGVADYSGLTIASRIGDISRFDSPRSLANYFGLTPNCRNSGEATDRLGSISKEGSGIVRFILGQMVVHVLKKDAWMREWYRKIRKRRGSKIARVAVMRRMVTIFWHMLTHDETYCAGGPPRLKLKLQKQNRDKNQNKNQDKNKSQKPEMQPA